MGTPRAQLQQLTEEALGECVRSLCAQLGWHFLWLRKTRDSSEGILDLRLTPLRHLDRRHILDRELKGYSRGRLGRLSEAQKETIAVTNAAHGDAAMWEPGDWFSNRIQDELR